MTDTPKEIIVGVLTSGDINGYLSNGLHQNAYFLYKLLELTPRIKPLLLYYPTTKEQASVDNLEIFGVTAHNATLFYEKYALDVLLLVSSVLNPDIINRFKKNNVKTVAIVYGNRYVMDQEVICYADLLPPSEGMRNPTVKSLVREDANVDAVWMSPHFAWQKDYMRYRYGAKRAFVCPYIWGPEIILSQFTGDEFWSKKDYFFHKGNEKNKNIFCTEPNIDVLKTSLFALQTVNQVYQRDNQNLGETMLLNCARAAKHNESFKEYYRSMPVAGKEKVFFEHRYKFSTITKYAQIMFHHHFMNGLNYTLLESALLGLPVVHNSEFMTDLGYYYKGANMTDAIAQLERALVHEEREDLDQYREDSLGVIEKFRYSDPSNIRGYQTLIANLFKQSVEPELPPYIVDLEYRLEHGDGYISPLV